MIRAVIGIGAAVALAAGGAGAQSLQPYVEDGEAALQKLRGAMMAEMQAAMAEGPGEAIGVCRHMAPQIGAEIEEETGWSIRRVSLRPRDPGNAPDARERGVLMAYHARAAAGQSPMAMRTTALYEEPVGEWGETERVVHMMQAVPMLEGCLACHGEVREDIAPATAERIAKLYPADRATGYEVGEIRGAFSLRRPFEPDFGAAPRPWDRIAALDLPREVPLADGATIADARKGRELYAARCKSCHAAEQLAGHFFGAAGAPGTEGLCLKLETHGATEGGQDCDIVAFLSKVAEAFGEDGPAE